MRVRKVSVLVDGGFFLKRLKSWPNINRNSPSDVADAVRFLCKRHVQKLCGEAENAENSRWLDHVYRLFFYDAVPYDGVPHQPFLNHQIEFAKTAEATFRNELFQEIRKKRKFALRLGSVSKASKRAYWTPYERDLRSLMKIWHEAEYIASILRGTGEQNAERTDAALRALQSWQDLPAESIQLPLRQKGVDMRIGLDITTMTLKHQVDTIVLVTGDSDFIPAAKVARREGVEFILDPMWQSVEDDLLEHVDGLTSGFDRPPSPR